MNWYLKVWKEYINFSGRARRTEYWMFNLFHFIALILLTFIDRALGTVTSYEKDGIGFFYLAYALLAFIPSLAVNVRRLHDTGRSGWYILINLIPLAGFIWYLVLMCLEGEQKINRWGDNPKGIGNDLAIDKIGTE